MQSLVRREAAEASYGRMLPHKLAIRILHRNPKDERICNG
jgi:hypothetical protein